MIFALVLLVLLGVSVLANLGHLLSSFSPMKMARARPAGPRLEEVVTEDNDAAAKIAVVEIDGIITSRAMDQGGYNMVDVIKAQLKRAEEDDKDDLMLDAENDSGEEHEGPPRIDYFA